MHTFQMNAYLYLLVSLLSLFLLGCRRSYRDAELVGSWQIITTGGIRQTYTFSPDHTFTIVTASSKDLRHFGDWVVDHDQLAIIVRSNSFTPTIVSNRETARIGKVTDSILILKDRDRNDEPRERTFQRLK